MQRIAKGYIDEFKWNSNRTEKVEQRGRNWGRQPETI
jgi:hypothetical protein